MGTAIDYESFITEGIIEHWNGSSWTVQTSPLPTGTDQRSLSGVAVDGAKFMAVGSSGESATVTYVIRSS
ncbi:MAG TPA: hypothetical protein VGI86_09915 [Acidimicrobiia bacterium]